ncbi:unnamed protein product [Tilletia controversa]|nr:unnamed protein product [Tilletia controversa]
MFSPSMASKSVCTAELDIAEIDVITTMERYCMMGQNNRILAHFEGKGETPGVVKDISSIEGKLPTILPRLVPSNVVEDGGKVGQLRSA